MTSTFRGEYQNAPFGKYIFWSDLLGEYLKCVREFQGGGVSQYGMV